MTNDTIGFASLTSLTVGSSPYNVPIEYTSDDSIAISCTSPLVGASGNATLTLQGSTDNVNWVTLPASVGVNPTTLTAATTTLFNIAQGAVACKYLNVNLVLNASGTLATFVVSINKRNASIVKN